MESGRNKRKIILIVCVCAIAGLTGIAIANVFLSPEYFLVKGFKELAMEIVAQEEELGKGFWTDAVNQIGSGNVQADYSMNLSGNPLLQNITVGLDGNVKRNMEQGLFGLKTQISVANADITEVSAYGKKDLQENASSERLYIQVPDLWDGSIVFDAVDMDGQWNASKAKSQLELATDEDLTIYEDMDLTCFRGFSVEQRSMQEFLEKNKETLKDLFQNMEVLTIKKALKQEKLTENQAEELSGVVLVNSAGKELKTTCYLISFSKEELSRIISDVTQDIRLCVYLDQGKRIVRICLVPGENIVMETGKEVFALNLLGEEAVIDTVEFSFSHTEEAEKLLWEAPEEITKEIPEEIPGEAPEEITEKITEKAIGEIVIKGTGVIEKNRKKEAAFFVKADYNFITDAFKYDFSLEGSIQGENMEKGQRILAEIGSFSCKRENDLLFRLSGRADVQPLTEEIDLPRGEEYHIGEMGELDTFLFLANCTKKLYANFGGYLYCTPITFSA